MSSDKKLKKLLTLWECPELIERFEKHKFKLATLDSMDPKSKSLVQLIPEIGIRELFLSRLKAYQNESESEDDQSKTSENDNHQNNSERESESDDDTSDDETVNLIANQGINKSTFFEKILNADLKEVIKSSVTGREVEAYYKLHQRFDYTHYTKLMQVITDFLLSCILQEPPETIRCKNFQFDNIADKLEALFPRLSKGIFYVAPNPDIGQTKAKGKVPQAYSKRTDHLKAIGIWPKKRKKNQNQLGKKNFMVHRNFNVATQEDDSVIEESYTWVQQYRSGVACSWEEIQQHWNVSRPLRFKDLQASEDMEIIDFFTKYEMLIQPKGFELIIQDYSFLFENGDSITSGWKNFSQKLEELLTKKVKCPMFKEYLEHIKTENCSQDARTAILLWMIPELVPIMKTIACPGKKAWRPSAADSKDGLIIHVQDSSEMDRVITELSDKLKRKNLDLQPIVIVTGPTLKDINAAYVQVDSVRYYTKSVLEALDVCYKVIHVTHAEYNKASNAAWLLIQRCLYQCSTIYDQPTPTFLANEILFKEAT